MHELVLKMLQCPECRGEITAGSEHFTCSRCQSSYPLLDSMPWLITQPTASLGEWRAQLKVLLQSLERDAEELKNDLRLPELMASTIRRMRKHLQAKVEQRKLIVDLLKPLNISDGGSYDLSAAMKTKLPKSQTLLSYYDNIHRDWIWGDKENAAGLACIQEIAGAEQNLGRLLISGAGSCRLLYDVAQTFKPDIVVGVDINPLLFLSARNILRGKSTKLYEFPIAPVDLESFSALRKCQAPEKLSIPLELIFADTMNLPFRTAAFDTVLTPWLIDIIPEDPKIFFPKLNRIIALGGRWFNFGSLVYQYKGPALDYSKDEIIELIEKSGFEIDRQLTRQIPYMQSPLSCHGRIESVFCFSAKKVREVEAPLEVRTNLPAWIIDPNLAIPSLSEFSSLRDVYQIYLDVLAKIDGKASITEIADGFSNKYQMTSSEAQLSIIRFFSRTFQELKSGR